MPLSLAEARQLASQNFRETCLRLSAACPGYQNYFEAELDAVTGPLEHPIVNFAFPGMITLESVGRLRRLAEQNPAMYVYWMPNQAQIHGPEMLIRSGFSLLSNFVVMMGSHESSREVKSQTSSIFEAGPNDRAEIAAFMVGQFFHEADPETRAAIHQSVASAHGTRLFGIQERHRIAAAMMLIEAPGTLGIYNLCVRSDRRQRGLGTALLNHALLRASESGLTPTLQCDAQIEPWYQQFGLKNIGNVQVFALQDEDKTAIMDGHPGRKFA